MGKWSKKAKEKQSARLKGYWKAKKEGKLYNDWKKVRENDLPFEAPEGGIVAKITRVINELTMIRSELGG